MKGEELKEEPIFDVNKTIAEFLGMFIFGTEVGIDDRYS
jgi:hypothetical protein